MFEILTHAGEILKPFNAWEKVVVEFFFEISVLQVNQTCRGTNVSHSKYSNLFASMINLIRRTKKEIEWQMHGEKLIIDRNFVQKYGEPDLANTPWMYFWTLILFKRNLTKRETTKQSVSKMFTDLNGRTLKLMRLPLPWLMGLPFLMHWDYVQWWKFTDVNEA